MKKKKLVQLSNTDAKNVGTRPCTSSTMMETSAVPDAEQSQSSLDLTEAVDLLFEVVVQACSTRDCPHEDDYLDSMALSAYADALRFLAKHGKVRIESGEDSRRVIAYVI